MAHQTLEAPDFLVPWLNPTTAEGRRVCDELFRLPETAEQRGVVDRALARILFVLTPEIGDAVLND